MNEFYGYSMMENKECQRQGQCVIHSFNVSPRQYSDWPIQSVPLSFFPYQLLFIITPKKESIYSLPNVQFLPDKKCQINGGIQTKYLGPEERMLLAEVIAANGRNK